VHEGEGDGTRALALAVVGDIVESVRFGFWAGLSL
jgi:hypothetical protein